MNRLHKPPPRRPQSSAYRQAFEHLDIALEENTPSDNREKIKLMRLAMFSDVDAYMKTNPIILPKP
jgi:hypothetical protein